MFSNIDDVIRHCSGLLSHSIVQQLGERVLPDTHIEISEEITANYGIENTD